MRALVFIFSLLIYLIGLSCYGQELQSNPDSVHQDQIFLKLPTSVNVINNNKIFKSVEAWGKGTVVQSKKIGYWEIFNSKGRLIAHRLYNDEGYLITEIQYNCKGKVGAVIRISNFAELGQDSTVRYGKYDDVILFQKNGKLKGRYYRSINGELIYKEY